MIPVPCQARRVHTRRSEELVNMTEVRRPTLDEIEAAARGLASVVRRTPLIPLPGHEDQASILLKPEVLQPAGSFKIRGIFHAVACMDETLRARGISTVSAGNTAKALAWCGRHFGVPARSLMPDTAPRTKIEAVRALGGEPVLVPTEEVFRYLKEHGWESEPEAFVHPWTNRNVMTGHGSMGLEIMQDCPEVETVYLPVGGGGLMGGVGSALKAVRPSVRIVAVEPEGCPALHTSLAAGRPMSVECETMCDGVAVPYITEEVFPLLASLVERVVLVSEDAVRSAIRTLAMTTHIVSEGAGALALAAALQEPAQERGVSVCPVTGGSIDAEVLAGILER